MATMFAENVRPILFLFGVVSVLLHYSCFLQLAMAISSSCRSPSNYTDQSALLAFQSGLTFDPTNTVLGGNWTTNTSFCNWIGVSCSKRRQRVTALDLSFMGLEGTISPHIGNLSFLVSLDLGNNSFIGSLPNEIASLHRLKVLVVQFNQLEGGIPPSLHHCQQLEVISLAYNHLSGVIPKQLGLLPRLQELYLGVNSLVGGIPPSLGNISTLETLDLSVNGLVAASIPSSLLNLSSLVLLYLAQNNISGVIPVDLCDRWPNIQALSFSWNYLSGQLPHGMDRCRELKILSLSSNSFVGSIPEQIGSLQNLEELYLGQNMLSGSIPPQIGNSSNLKKLDIMANNIVGSIPRSLGQLSSLVYLSVDQNSLEGPIPKELFNLSSLQFFAAFNNSLSGTFPSNMGVWLPSIQRLYFGSNQITGHIPSFFSNLSEVIQLDVSFNSLYGQIPLNLGSLKHLRFLNLEVNQLTRQPGVLELRFLSSLFNSTSLEDLVLDGNPLNGIIPYVSGNSSYSSLHQIFALGCQIKGHIPKTIGSFQNLTTLDLSDNNMSGELPSSIFRLKTLQRLYLGYNNISGYMPNELCLMKDLGELSLENNQFIGSIPSCIGNLSRLEKVFLNSNRLTSSVPVNLLNLESLLSLNLSFNMLAGYLPSSTRKSNSIQAIDISHNQITGSIPSIIGDFQSLESLNLSNNLLIGSIPQGFGDLKGLVSLDLSSNDLTGSIPNSLEKLKFLKYLNFSFNQLCGDIPSGGPFSNFTAQAFLENRALCGRPDLGIPRCRAHSTQKSKTLVLLTYILPVIASIMILIVLAFMWTKYSKRNASISTSHAPLTEAEHKLISYHELRCATDDFCESNLLGAGGFGSVYKGVLSDGTTVAVKVLNMQLEGACKSFDAECNVWRAIRHRNLVKVMTTCSSPEVKALVLEYMPNGSLEKWLYSHNYCLTLVERVSILINIASALEYLHHGQSELVVHCDLKPSNVLLDEDIVAHVGDFGIANILAKDKDATQTRTLGTIGYVAPEYGWAGKVSTKGDVYNFGIMMMEIMARKNPTDEMFSGQHTLREWIYALLPDNIMEVVDAGLLSLEEGVDMNSLKGILQSILEIGCKYSEELPENRMDIKEAVPKLMKLKLSLHTSKNSQRNFR